MVTLRELAARAVELGISTSPGDAVADAEHELIGLQIKPRIGTSLWLPKGRTPTWVEPAVKQADAVFPDQGAMLITDLALRPYRVYELAARPPKRVLAVVGSYRRAGSFDTYLAVGRIHAEQVKRTVLSSGPFELALVPLSDIASARLALERLALQFVPAEVSRLKGKLASLVLGGTPNSPGPNWQQQVAAVLWSYGYVLTALHEPWRREASVNHRLSTQQADLYIFLRAWMIDGQGYDHTDDLMSLVGGNDVIDTEDMDTLDGVLEIIRLELLELGGDVPEAIRPLGSASVSAGSSAEPQDWAELYAALDDLDEDSFVITTSARSGCLDCGYSNPSRMWEHLVKLRDAAIAWVAADCAVGDRFADWIREDHGLHVALFDSAIEGTDAATFDYYGITYSRVPHVQLDQAKAFTDIGRIHFALDTDGRRLIVDHIGLKLLGRQAAK